MLRIFFLIFLITQSIRGEQCSTTSDESLTIETTSGKLSGSCDQIRYRKHKKKLSANVYTWLGVPYAEPPVGENRFKHPVPIQSRLETIDATKWPNSCMQLIDKSDYTPPGTKQAPFPGFSMWRIDKKFSNMSEDCLYLNIFVPARVYEKKFSTKLPIMVYFHGGSTVFGSSAMDVYNPSSFVAETNTIVITVNYRLGVFGYLYIENEFPGNQALADQNEALKWINLNAKKFGGNPNKVTIYGQSAGSMIGGYHLFYKSSWPFFRNMILQSGSPLFEPLFPISKTEANRRASDFLSTIGCPNSTNSDLANCVKEMNSSHVGLESIKYFDKFSESYHTSMYLMTAFVLVLTDDLQHPVNALKTGDFKKCPIIIGFNKDEGTLFSAVTGFADLKTYSKISYPTMNFFVNSYFHYYPNYGNKSNIMVKTSVMWEYMKILNGTNQDEIVFSSSKVDYFNQLSNIFTDQMFICPAYRLADLISLHNPNVYVYLLDHYVSSSPWPKWYGTTHSDELAFVFGHTISLREPKSLISVNPWANKNHKYTNEEINLTFRIFKMWSNFANDNNPNGVKMKPTWTKYKEKKIEGNLDLNGKFLNLNVKKIEIKNDFNSIKVCHFWNYLLPKIANSSS